jgi:hypothetical protein
VFSGSRRCSLILCAHITLVGSSHVDDVLLCFLVYAVLRDSVEVIVYVVSRPVQRCHIFLLADSGCLLSVSICTLDTCTAGAGIESLSGHQLS